MSIGKLAILIGAAVALIGFVLITNWHPQGGFIWNIQRAEIVLWVEEKYTEPGLITPSIRKRVIARIPYSAVLIVSIGAIACGIYMENSERWRNTRL